VEERLCFGRLDLTGGEHRYVGRIGLSDDDRAQLLIDWRAPAAADFYQATAAAPNGVIRRRHIATRGRTVTGLDDEVLDAEAVAEAAANGNSALTTITGEGALMTAITAHRTGRMRDIVATLQSEQDRVVRAPLAGVLVVQGGPGTGKTAVALHRAAYLLYTHRDRIARSGVLVVGPSPVFLRYIEQVLPSLGETGVVLTTLAELYPGVEATALDPPEVAVVKGDLRMATVIRAAVRDRQRRIDVPIPLRLDGDLIELQPRVVATARARARSTGKPHNGGRVTFVLHMLDDLADQLAAARAIRADDLDARADLLAELRASIDVRREINLRWMPLTPEKLVQDLFASPARLDAAARGILTERERELLFRDRGSPWTAADVPLLDEAAELVGEDTQATAAQAARLARERAEALDYARGVLRMSGDLAEMVSAEMLADRFASGGPDLTLAERAQADRAWTYGHAVVDEAQELSGMQWRMVLRRVPSRSMTVVGDVAQTGSAAGTTDWTEVLDQHAADRWRVAELTVNYRTPERIMNPAVAMLRAAGIEVTPPTSAREGDWAPVAERVRTRDPAAVAAAVVAALRADDAVLGGGRFAVVVPRASRADLAGQLAAALATAPPAATLATAPSTDGRRPQAEPTGTGTGGGTDADTGSAGDPAGPGSDLAERVSVHTVDDVKGLEFDGVVVVDPVAVVAESPRGVNDLYVALTRPTQRLTVLHHGTLPPGLESLAAD